MTHLHTTRLPVRWGDMDAFGHVNNARYFTYFEHARIEALMAVGDAMDGATPILAQTSCRFRRPVVFPAEVLVRVHADAPGRSSLRTTYTLSVVGDEDVVYAEGEAVVVWVDPAAGTPVPVPAAFREALAARAAEAEG